jgi:hypothetical protein
MNRVAGPKTHPPYEEKMDPRIREDDMSKPEEQLWGQEKIRGWRTSSSANTRVIITCVANIKLVHEDVHQPR